MTLTKEAKQEIVQKHGTNDSDTGSTKVQVALLTTRINQPVSYTHLTLPTIYSV